MNVQDAYLEVAERSADTAQLANDNAFPEAGAFLAYHAFESIGGAWCTHLGKTAIQMAKLRHNAKLTEFVRMAKGYGFGHQSAALAIKVGSQRNEYLYPRYDGGSGYATPKDVRKKAEVTKIIAEVRGLFRKVKKQL